MRLNAIARFTISILASFAAAGIGSLFTFRAIPEWYSGLKKPPLTPPNQAFGPIWTTLYTMMAVSVFLIWQKGLYTDGALTAFILFWSQLAANAVWSIVFFGMRSQGGGAITVSILWLLILATIISSFRVSRWAGALLIPYIIWTSIASYLNVGVWVLNKPERKAVISPDTSPGFLR